MQLTLTDDDARMLRNVLLSYLPGLRREAAGTDLASRELRHELAQRERLCERLLEELQRGGPDPSPGERDGPGEGQFRH